MRYLLILILLIGSVLCLSAGENEEALEIEIAKWQGNTSGAVTLSFDDGYLATYISVIPILDEYGINGTFNLITGLVGGKYGVIELASWEMWVEAANTDHEIASHTYSHSHVDEISGETLEEELRISKEDIKKNIGIPTISFVYPGGAYSAPSKRIVERYFLSARTSDGGYNNAAPEDLHLLKSKTVATNAADEMNGWADETEENGLWLIENLHLVSSENPSNYPFYISTTDFMDHIAYLNSKNMWIASQGEVAKYITEREGSNVTVLDVSSSRIFLDITTYLNPSVFNEPLTIIISLPREWDSAVVFSANGNMMKSSFSEGILQFDARPGQNGIVIEKS
jgi:peptidoglycan/xylan/chitin deacetylase (PgdA/CDA1 family)